MNTIETIVFLQKRKKEKNTQREFVFTLIYLNMMYQRVELE